MAAATMAMAARVAAARAKVATSMAAEPAPVAAAMAAMAMATAARVAAARAKAATSMAAAPAEECAICMEDFEQGNLLREMDCGNRFHCQCLGDMPDCPLPRCGLYCQALFEGKWAASGCALVDAFLY